MAQLRTLLVSQQQSGVIPAFFHPLFVESAEITDVETEEHPSFLRRIGEMIPIRLTDSMGVEGGFNIEIPSAQSRYETTVHRVFVEIESRSVEDHAVELTSERSCC